jgi:GntR family transcriptional regulator
MSTPAERERAGADRREAEQARRGPPPSPPLAATRLFDQRALARLFEQFRRGERLGDGATLASTMFSVQLDPESLVPLHEQVASEIRRALAEEQCRPGDRLPPARDLAAVLGVNPNTVLRALRDLRDEGLLEFRRGRGITVTGSAEHGALVVKARELVRFARRQGYRRDELIRLIEALP